MVTTKMPRMTWLALRRFRRCISFPFDQRHDLSNRHVPPHFFVAVRPSHLDPLDAHRSAQAGMDAQVVLRVIAAASTDLANERGAASDDADARADGAAVGPGEPTSAARSTTRRRRQSSRYRFGVSCTLFTATSTSPSLSKSPNAAPRPRAARHAARQGARSRPRICRCADCDRRPCAVCSPPRSVSLFHLGIHVPVHEKQIEPAIMIEVEKPDAPSEPSRVDADAARERVVLAESRRRYWRTAWTCRPRSWS